jgi:hypothetical protein
MKTEIAAESSKALFFCSSTRHMPHNAPNKVPPLREA